MPTNPQWNGCTVSAALLLEHDDDPDWVIVDCRFNLMRPAAGRLAWASGHIPGAVYADLNRDLASPVADDGSGGRHPLPDPAELAATLTGWGIHAGTTVIAYDDAGNALAARLWWLLRWLGHERVAVLDGGLDGWAAAGGQLSAESTHEPAAESNLSAHPAFTPKPGSLPVTDAVQIQAGLDRGALVLLDARAAERFDGRQEPIDTRAGHVPGAINAPFQTNLDADKCLRPAADLAAYYRRLIADRPMTAVACMCGSGVTACHTLLALEAAGMRGASLYVGSWSDWISPPQRPIAAE